MLLACVFLGELIAGVAVQGPVHDRPLAPAHRAEFVDSSPSTPLVVGDRTVALLSLGGAGTNRLLSHVAANIGGAVDQVTAFWGSDWPRDISIVATGSDEEFRAAAGGSPVSQWADIAAVTVVERVDLAHRLALGQRIVFAPGAASMGASALRIVLTHELFHYAARVDTAVDAPRWLTEGIADFVARPPTAVPAGALSVARSLPSDTDLDIPGSLRSIAYDRAWWFARFVADDYGTAKLRELYLVACGVGHPDLATALHDVLGTDSAALLMHWQQWLIQ